MTTWLRGARCTDPEAMPEMEARPPAENRHGGAPRGERPASWDAPRLTSADQSRLANATTEQVRLSALRPPLVGVDAKGKERTRAQQRAAGTKNTALFDIVNGDDGQRFASRAATSQPASRVPGERSEHRSGTEGRHDRSPRQTILRCAESLRWIPALVPLARARSLHSAGTRDPCALRLPSPGTREHA